METVLYADILFLVNFAMDFISLSASASLGAKPKKPLRISIAAALGAVYSIAATVSGLKGLPQYILAAAVGASMCAVSFGFGGFLPFIRQYIIFWGCGALLGGIMTALLSIGSVPLSEANLPITALSALTVLLFLIKAIRERSGCKHLTLDIRLGARHIKREALCDSGNLLRDPFTGMPVVIISHEALEPLLEKPLVSAMLSCDAEALEHSPLKIRLIPHGSNSENGFLCAFMPDCVSVSNGKRKTDVQCLMAISPHHSTYFGGFAATAPSVLIP